MNKIDIKTEGINYMGSKKKLIPDILEIIKQTNSKYILDGFSGTTRVSQALLQSGYKVWCNDITYYSEIFGNCYLKSMDDIDGYIKTLNYMNNLKPINGWFTKNYGGLPNRGVSIQKDGLKRPFQIHNMRKTDAIINYINLYCVSKVDRAV